MMMKSKKGFSLIELLIVIAIIGILAALAVPKYKEYTLRAKFADVMNAVLPIKQSMVTCYAENNSYANCSSVVYNTNAQNTNTQEAFRNAVWSVNVENVAVLNRAGVAVPDANQGVRITALAATTIFGTPTDTRATANQTANGFSYILEGAAEADGSQFWRVSANSTCLADNATNTVRISLCKQINGA